MCKVLVVEDDASLREAVAAALASHGHDVSLAPNGMAALRAAVERWPEIIISDVNMPHLEGPDMVRILKALPRFRAVPVILMSGAELPLTDLTQTVLRKPVHVDELLELVTTLGQSTASYAGLSELRPKPLVPTTADDERRDPTSAVASLGAASGSGCAARDCRGIELMHDQAYRLGQLHRRGLRVEESEQLYERLVDSVATLVQYLPIEASMSAQLQR